MHPTATGNAPSGPRQKQRKAGSGSEARSNHWTNPPRNNNRSKAPAVPPRAETEPRTAPRSGADDRGAGRIESEGIAASLERKQTETGGSRWRECTGEGKGREGKGERGAAAYVVGVAVQLQSEAVLGHVAAVGTGRGGAGESEGIGVGAGRRVDDEELGVGHVRSSSVSFTFVGRVFLLFLYNLGRGKRARAVWPIRRWCGG